MFTTASEISIKDIAAILQTRRYSNKRTVLFLGSRASQFWRNTTLYKNVEKFGANSFYKQSHGEKFEECYKVLSNRARFKETDVHQLLVAALNSHRQREEDVCLAELLREDFFDVIISTGIDDILESACEQADLEEGQDVCIVNPLRGAKLIMPHREHELLTIVKTFGDLESRWYATAGNELELNVYPELQQYLKTTLEREVLLLGYDPVWDKPIELAFPLRGRNVYYVNEQRLADNSTLTKVLHRRNGFYCVGSYRSFMRTLHQCLIHHYISLPVSLPPGVVVDEQEQAMYPLLSPGVVVDEQEQARKIVFISYCHRDKRYLDELLPHLNIYEQKGLIDVWSDLKIATGTEWREQISKALDTARVAVLLVSKHFLASKFIQEIELPQLLEAASKRGLVILPIALSPCVIENTSLHHLQFINSLNKPLSKIRRVAEREEIWVKMVKKIIKA